LANILVIDGEAVLLDLISNTLRLDGHHLIALSSPIAALGAREAGHPPIDLLLTDIDTEPISGFELVKRLSKKGFNGAVVFMSANAAVAAAVSESLGERAVLEKPFTAARLRMTVRRGLARSKVKPASAA
jgi:two-component system, NtrC family, nitrogen regulation response regulator NtrX